MKRQTVLIVCLVVLVGLAAGGYYADWLWRHANYYEVTRTEYHEPPRQDDVLVDDTLADKNPAFDATLIDSRPLGDWEVNSSAAVVRLDCPMIKPDIEGSMLMLRPSYRDAVTAARDCGMKNVLPSANLIDGAAKQFDDGLYAAMDLACFRGELGLSPAAPQWVAAVFSHLPAKSPARAFLAAALELGGEKAPRRRCESGREGQVAGRLRARQGREQADRLLYLDARIAADVAILSVSATRVRRRPLDDSPRRGGRVEGSRRFAEAVSSDQRLLRAVDESVGLSAGRCSDRRNAGHRRDWRSSGERRTRRRRCFRRRPAARRSCSSGSFPTGCPPTPT